MDRLSALQAFLRLADGATFVAVAQELSVRQSTVSKWLALLEEDLGVQLMERTSRARRLTPAGTRFVARAREVVAAYQSAAGEARAETGTPRGRVRISLPVVYGRLHVVPRLARFLDQHAGIELEVGLDDRYVSLVAEGVDVAVRVGVPVDSTLRCRTVAVGRRLLVAAPSYVETNGFPARPAELAAHRCLVHSGLGAGDVWSFRKGSRKERAEVRGTHTATNSEVLLRLCRGGHGLALLADWLVSKDVAAGRLVEAMDGWAAPPAPVHVLTVPTGFPRPEVTAVVDFIARTLAATDTVGVDEV